MIAPPLILYAVGVVLGEFYQWGNWIPRNPGKPWHEYWLVGLPHGMTNLVIVAGVATLWAEGGLDAAINMLIPGAFTEAWANTGVPYTPQCGLLLGAAADVAGDQIAYLVRLVAGKKWPALAPSTPPATPTDPPKGD